MGKEQEAGSATASGGARIVVVGGGVAGLEIATALGKGRTGAIGSVTLVDSDSAHVWKPMLHTIAAGTRDLAQQQTTYLAQASDASFAYQPGEMCGLDREAREVLLAPIEAPDGREIVPGRRIAYDRLVIAVGSGANDFGTPGVDEHCFMIDSRRKADAFNSEIRLRMVRCMTSGEQLRVAIVGGGATGVELAAELVQLSRQQPGRLTVGTDGVGTSLHLTAEMLQQQAGLSWTHVPYKSGPQALTELAGGQIDLAVLPVALVQSFVREGKLRGLGVTSRQRAATLPQTPSLSDTAVWQAFDVEAWQGLLLPARTDARIAERLARETAAVLAEPELVRKLAEAGFKPMVMEQAQFTAHLQRERKLLEATVQAARLQGTG